jgi:hypothetical protein
MTFRVAPVCIPALALASWMAGCSGGTGSSTPPATSGPYASASWAPGLAKASTTSDGCPVNTGFVGDDACIAPPPASEGFQLHYGATDYTDPNNVGPYVLDPSGETVDCYYLKTPNTKDVYVGGYQFSLRPGSHHLNANINTAAQPDGFATCGANDMSPGLLFGTETPQVDELVDPAPENAGLASPIPANGQAVINFHVINTTAEPTLREAWLNYMYIDASQVKGIRGTLFLLGGLGYEIAPGTKQTYTYSCSPDRPVRILDMAAHMHAHATRMTAWKVSNGQPTEVYETYNWATPTDLRFDSAHPDNPLPNAATQTGGGMSGTLTVDPSESIQWECAVDNTSDVTLTFRNEVYTGEMCIMTGSVVPADNPMDAYSFTCTRN